MILAGNIFRFLKESVGDPLVARRPRPLGWHKLWRAAKNSEDGCPSGPTPSRKGAGCGDRRRPARCQPDRDQPGLGRHEISPVPSLPKTEAEEKGGESTGTLPTLPSRVDPRNGPILLGPKSPIRKEETGRFGAPHRPGTLPPQGRERWSLRLLADTVELGHVESVSYDETDAESH